MKKVAKKLMSITLAGVVSSTVAFNIANAAGNEDVSLEPIPTHQDDGTAKNVILLIGDGMGQNQVSAASYYQGDGFGTEDLVMDQFTDVGFARTYSHDNTVTDSAAAATAFSSTHKTDNGVLGKAPENQVHSDDEEHFDVETVLESAESNDMATGLVSTARITHATPAAFASHIGSRDEENQIAEQMLLEHDIEVMLGGGKRHFLPKEEGGKREDKKNLIDSAEEKGYEIVTNKSEMNKTEGGKLLGLFSNSHMTYELDRDMTEEPSLDEMTEKALGVLKDDKNGFFLMVEGGRIDHAGHANYPATNIHETLAFDRAVEEALQFAKEDGDTLVIVSADHETGGMSIGLDGQYGFNKDVIRNMRRTTEYISSQLDSKYSNVEVIMAEYAGINDLTKEEKELITSNEDAAAVIAEIISDRSLIGWTTTGHTAVHVPVYSYGPMSNKLVGTIDNTKIAEVISKSTGNKLTSQSLIDAVDRLKEEGNIANDKVARSLKLHLTAISQYEEKGLGEKVIKHLNSFLELLDHNKEKELITDEAHRVLKKDTENLMNRWQ